MSAQFNTNTKGFKLIIYASYQKWGVISTRINIHITFFSY